MSMNKMKKFITGLLIAFLIAVSFSKTGYVYAAGASDYAAIFDASYYAAANPDVAAALGTDENVLLNHFLTSGIAEGRRGCAEFDLSYYMECNSDLVAAFGSDYASYYNHYLTSGKAEGRIGSAESASGVSSQNTSNITASANTTSSNTSKAATNGTGPAGANSSATNKASTTKTTGTSSYSTSTSTTTNESVVYWTPNGTRYHSRLSCPSLQNSTNVISGTLSQCPKDKRTPCKRCH